MPPAEPFQSETGNRQGRGKDGVLKEQPHMGVERSSAAACYHSHVLKVGEWWYKPDWQGNRKKGARTRSSVFEMFASCASCRGTMIT